MMLSFRLKANQSFFSVGNLECQFNATALPQNLSKFRALKACTPLNQRSTRRPVVTNPSIKQNERILSWDKPKFNHGSGGRGSSNHKNNGGFVGPFVPKVNVNVTVELPNSLNSRSGKGDGLKFTLSVYAVIVIAVATVIVVVIIAIVIIAKRCQGLQDGSNGSGRNRDMDDSYDREDDVTNEMCTFFGSYQRGGSNRGNSNRPVIEVHRHSIHCDTLDELPPAYREFGTHDYGHQPITTHIDVSYKPQRKTLGMFC